VTKDSVKLTEAAVSMGLRAVRDPDGGVSLLVAAADLPPRLRELAAAIAVPAVPEAAEDLLTAVLVWIVKRGFSLRDVLAEVAAMPPADLATARAAVAASLDRRASPPRPVAREEGDEILDYLGELARRAGEVRRPRREGGSSFLELLGSGVYSDVEPKAPKDFADFVSRIGIYVDHAVARHGGTARLEHLRAMIRSVRERGIDAFEREDPGRAARLMAMWPDLVERLRNYRPDPGSLYDKPLPRRTPIRDRRD
jgi:hypothetical protein